MNLNTFTQDVAPYSKYHNDGGVVYSFGIPRDFNPLVSMTLVGAPSAYAARLCTDCDQQLGYINDLAAQDGTHELIFLYDENGAGLDLFIGEAYASRIILYVECAQKHRDIKLLCTGQTEDFYPGYNETYVERSDGMSNMLVCDCGHLKLKMNWEPVVERPSKFRCLEE